MADLKQSTPFSRKKLLLYMSRKQAPTVQAYYMIKAALDKQELLQQKQDLLTAIRGGEEDVTGLEGALADMSGSNGELAQSFRYGSL